MLYISFFKKE